MTYPIPAAHDTGDAGHTTDHNSIIQVLTSFAEAITNLQAVSQNNFQTTGGNNCAVSGDVTSWAVITLPSDDRDNAADTIDVYYGTIKVFSLNGYGEVRLYPAATSHVPLIIQGQTGQTSNLLQINNGSGNQTSAIDMHGNITASNNVSVGGTVVFPGETWHNLTAASGWTVSAAQYQFIPVCGGGVAFRGTITTPSSGVVNTVPATQPLPAMYRPAANRRWPVSNTTSAGVTGFAYVQPGGAIQFSGLPSGYNGSGIDITGTIWL
jgi:hypothetical protein